MKKKTTKKIRKQKLKLPIASIAEIQDHLVELIEKNPDMARQQLWVYWIAMTNMHLAWGGKAATKDLKRMLIDTDQDFFGKPKKVRK